MPAKRTHNPQLPKFSGVYDRHPRIVGLFGFLRIHRRARLRPPTRIVGGMKFYFLAREKMTRDEKKLPLSKFRRGSPLPKHGM